MLIATVSTISLIFLIAFVAAMIILQVYLSRRESKLQELVPLHRVWGSCIILS